MSEKKLIIPFITSTPDQKEVLSSSAEIACVMYAAEAERRKPGLIRDSSERIVFVSKAYYPMWILSGESACILIEGLGVPTFRFTFYEPVKTESFIEELKKNSMNSTDFIASLKVQTKAFKEFVSPVNEAFIGLIADKEIKGFILEHLKHGEIDDGGQVERDSTIPIEIVEKTAALTRQSFTNYLRTIRADTTGIKAALSFLDEEIQFHENGLRSEIEIFEEKKNREIESLKPIVDKKVAKLNVAYEKALKTLEDSVEKKTRVLENKLEKLLQRLQVQENKRNAVQDRMNSAKRRRSSSKSTSSSLALKKYEKALDSLKKEIKRFSGELEKTKKEAETKIKTLKSEYQNSVSTEERQITQINDAYLSRISGKQKQIQEMGNLAKEFKINLENIIKNLSQSGLDLKNQIEIDWKMDSPKDIVLAHLPFYLIKYTKGKEGRYSLISPVALSDEAGVLSGLKKMFAINSEPVLKTIMHPASKRLQETLSAYIFEKMNKYLEFGTRLDEICQRNNIIDLSNFGETLNEGLDEIEKRGWMKRDESLALCRRIMGDKY